MTREEVVVAGVRTAVGDFGGSLKDFSPTQLGAMVVKEVVARAGVSADQVGHVVFGHVVNSEPRDMYLSRVAAIEGGLDKSTPALTLNRLCGSGLQAIVTAAQSIMLGDADVAIGGGAESMSKAPYILPAARWGARMGDMKGIDMMVGALHDPFHVIHMGVTAENVAKEFNVSREDQDALAVESHKRAANAIANGYFKEQILPIEIKSKKGPVMFDTDEHVRGDATVEGMAKLKTVFQKDGTVTAGNASGLNDGAGAVLLMERSAAEKAGKKPMARLVAYANTGVEPTIMGIGPVSATKKALAKAGLSKLLASIPPSAAPAPTMVWISSRKRITSPWACLTSSITDLSRSSNSPRNLEPATSPPMSRANTRRFFSELGTSPATMREASPSAMAVLPTPASPMMTGLFFFRRLNVCITCRISSSRPTTGSSLPSRASLVRSMVYFSKER